MTTPQPTTDPAAPVGASTPAASKPDARSMPPLLKIVLELGPLLVFFLVFWLSKDDGGETAALLRATAWFMGALFVAMAITYALTRTLSRIMILTGAVVAVLGTLTLILGDDNFIKARPTVVNAAFAAVLGYGLWQGRSFLQYVIGELFPMSDEGWMKLTRNWAVFFAFMAVLNLVVWLTMSGAAWALAKTFVYPGLVLVFMLSQAPLMARHAIEQTDTAQSSSAPSSSARSGSEPPST